MQHLIATTSAPAIRIVSMQTTMLTHASRVVAVTPTTIRRTANKPTAATRASTIARAHPPFSTVELNALPSCLELVNIDLMTE
jgi:hypothetical protein